MLKALGLRSRGPSEDTSPAAIAQMIIDEAIEFEIALKAMDFMLDDRTDEGLALLKDKNCTIYKLATGVVQFIEATLGFEPEVMKKAHDTLSEAESLSAKDRARCQKLKIKSSSIYPPGTVYAVTYAESNLLCALTMLLSESMIEVAKALYKLRKAYHTLDEISKQIAGQIDTIEQRSEDAWAETQSMCEFGADRRSSSFAQLPRQQTLEELQQEKLHASAEKVYELRYRRMCGTSISATETPIETPSGSSASLEDLLAKKQIADPRALFQSAGEATIDEFIHSGVNLCFGILQVVLSLIPSGVGKVLAIVGFKGSREQGLKMLWDATKARNIHGGIALAALLIFYLGPFQFTDSDFTVEAAGEETEAETLRTNPQLALDRRASREGGAPTLNVPGRKLEEALKDIRRLFPNNALWILQEGKLLESRGKLAEAVALMDSVDKLNRPIQMQQVEALLVFDRAMMITFMHQFDRASSEFYRMMSLNAWSYALYTFLSGVCHVELYRLALTRGEPHVAAEHKKKAEELIRRSPTLVGQKGSIKGRKMPFDMYLMRKVGEWESTAKASRLDFVDAITTSPVHEIMYFWSGYNRMTPDLLETSLRELGYSAQPGSTYAWKLDADRGETGEIHSPLAAKEKESDEMMRSFLQAICLRGMGRVEEGLELLDTKVISRFMINEPGVTRSGTPKYKVIRRSEDPWMYPAALFERAIFVWKLKGLQGLAEARDYLHRAHSWSDDYELSTRIVMKIKSAIDRLESI